MTNGGAHDGVVFVAYCMMLSGIILVASGVLSFLVVEGGERLFPLLMAVIGVLVALSGAGVRQTAKGDA